MKNIKISILYLLVIIPIIFFSSAIYSQEEKKSLPEQNKPSDTIKTRLIDKIPENIEEVRAPAPPVEKSLSAEVDQQIIEDEMAAYRMSLRQLIKEAESRIKEVDGKIRLVKESLCDGLGACVGRCPTGALVVEERDAEAFDEEEAQKNMAKNQQQLPRAHGGHGGGCPGSMAMQWNNASTKETADIPSASALRQWPIQLKLLNPHAPYFHNADLVVAADCVPFSYPNFHNRFLKGKALIILCPKLDDAQEDYMEKLTEIFRSNEIRSVAVVHMEVPCCSGTTYVVEEAVKRSGKSLTIKDYTISLKGEII